MTFDDTNATLEVQVFREGVLSAVGHDLLLRARRFRVELSDARDRLTATCETASLEVSSALRDGRELPGAFGDGDLRRIERSMRGEVLDVERHPEARFETRRIGPHGTFEGTLTLHGATRELSGRWREEDGRLVGELAVDQPAFGIRPFTAMLGALKVRREVIVRLTLRTSAGGSSAPGA